MAERFARQRTSYHHGDLRAALITAGIDLAREGGPQAVVLREVARVVGVAPNSAYSHFATLALLKRAVTQRALHEMGAAMQAHVDAVADAPPADPQDAAKTHLREVGRAYVHYALTEPGLFRMAMGGDPTGIQTPGTLKNEPDIDPDERPKPDAVLLHALARLNDAGCLDPTQTNAAATACWATVHGLSIMLLDLLPPTTTEQQKTAVEDALDVLVAGLTARLS